MPSGVDGINGAWPAMNNAVTTAAIDAAIAIGFAAVTAPFVVARARIGHGSPRSTPPIMLSWDRKEAHSTHRGRKRNRGHGRPRWEKIRADGTAARPRRRIHPPARLTWVSREHSMYRRAAVVLALTVVTLPSLAGTASGQGIVVDHTSVALFEQIPEEYLAAAAALTMMFVDRSVGVNINDGLTCLSYPSDEAAPTSCKRYAHVVPAFSSSPSEVNWSRAGGYSRANWDYYGWPGGGIPPELPCGRGAGSWHEKLGCFIAYVDANPARYRVFSYQNSFLEADTGSDIARPVTGYFAAQADRFDIAD